MTPAARREYLTALGLTDWQPRQAPVAEASATPAQAANPAPTAPAASKPGAVPKDEGAASHGELAQFGWAELEAWLRQRDHRGARQPVFGVGAHDADLLLIGEAPGAREDEQGLPFVGQAGKLLDRMLAAIGRSRAQNVYITNICKFRPPGNRDPQPAEVAADWPVLERQIELLQPRLVVALGRVAAQTLLSSTESLGRLRGEPHRYPQ
ncbi:MAG TPA: uracil-DNA glycosylase, partial [Salinisphaeraceae bacterium]|nr:uracil-DNA glycosylase [Salinisphaeraceae bacterium]